MMQTIARGQSVREDGIMGRRRIVGYRYFPVKFGFLLWEKAAIAS